MHPNEITAILDRPISQELLARDLLDRRRGRLIGYLDVDR